MAKRSKKSSFKKLFIWVFVLILVTFVLYFGYMKLFHGQSSFVPSDDPVTPKIQIVNEDSTTRPYGVMINNLKVARSLHSGLQDAYLVYEMIVEGGITRFYALFSDVDTTRIGPVRSARHYYLDYAMENDSYFVHWGFSELAKSDISKYGISNVNGLYKAKYFWKDNTLKVATEHRAFTSMELLKQAVSDMNYREKRAQNFLLQYSSLEQDFSNDESVLDATQISIPYSSGTKTSYEYDPDQKVYKRFVNGEVHQDYVTKKQYTVKNIITYKVKNYAIDDYGRQNLDNVGSGTGYYITNGKAKMIRWEKKSRESQTQYTYPDGTPLVVNDGNTWIQIQPESQKLTIS